MLLFPVSFCPGRLSIPNKGAGSLNLVLNFGGGGRLVPWVGLGGILNFLVNSLIFDFTVLLSLVSCCFKVVIKPCGGLGFGGGGSGLTIKSVSLLCFLSTISFFAFLVELALPFLFPWPLGLTVLVGVVGVGVVCGGGWWRGW